MILPEREKSEKEKKRKKVRRKYTAYTLVTTCRETKYSILNLCMARCLELKESNVGFIDYRSILQK